MSINLRNLLSPRPSSAGVVHPPSRTAVPGGFQHGVKVSSFVQTAPASAADQIARVQGLIHSSDFYYGYIPPGVESKICQILPAMAEPARLKLAQTLQGNVLLYLRSKMSPDSREIHCLSLVIPTLAVKDRLLFAKTLKALLVRWNDSAPVALARVIPSLPETERLPMALALAHATQGMTGTWVDSWRKVSGESYARAAAHSFQIFIHSLNTKESLEVAKFFTDFLTSTHEDPSVSYAVREKSGEYALIALGQIIPALPQVHRLSPAQVVAGVARNDRAGSESRVAAVKALGSVIPALPEADRLPLARLVADRATYVSHSGFEMAMLSDRLDDDATHRAALSVLGQITWQLRETDRLEVAWLIADGIEKYSWDSDFRKYAAKALAAIILALPLSERPHFTRVIKAQPPLREEEQAYYPSYGWDGYD